MRRKFFIALAVTLLFFLFLAVIIIPYAFQAQLNTGLKREINNRLNAEVNYNNFSLSLIRSFPNLNISMNDITLTGLNEFKGDTLAFISRLSFSTSLRSIIKSGGYQILSFEIIQPKIRAIINPDGHENWDILKPSPGIAGSGPVTPFSFEVTKYAVQKAEVNYTDRRTGSITQIHHLNLKGNGNIINDFYKLEIHANPTELYYQSDSLSHQIVAGSLNLSLHFKASKNDIARKNYEAFEFSGNGNIFNLQYTDSKIHKPVAISNSHISITPANVTLDSLNISVGKSELSVRGAIGNYISYLLNKGDLNGELIAHSTIFDANEWLKKDTATAKGPPVITNKTGATVAKPKPSYFKVPAHINLTIHSQFDTILNNKFVIENLKGQLLVRDEAVDLNGVSANLLGGSATLAAKYDTKNTKQPAINFAYSIRKMDIRQAYQDIKAIAQVAPGVQYVTGICSGSITGSGKLKPDMSVDYQLLAGEGNIFMPDIKITELPVLNEIYKIAKIPSLQNLEVKDAQTSFTFKNGRVNLAPIGLKFTNGYSMFIKGSSGFDQRVDYDMKLDVPAKQVVSSSPIAQGILSFLPGLAGKLPQTMEFTFKITGNAVKPNVKLLNMAPVDAKNAKTN